MGGWFCTRSRDRGLFSGADFYGRADSDVVPDFIDFRIGDGDAAGGPVHLAMRGAEEGVLRGEAVNLDVAAGVDAELTGAFAIGCVGVGEVQGAMEEAVGIFCVDRINAFWRLFVARLGFGAVRIAEGDFVGFEDLAVAEELHGVSGFEDEDAVGGGVRGLRERRAEQNRDRCNEPYGACDHGWHCCPRWYYPRQMSRRGLSVIPFVFAAILLLPANAYADAGIPMLPIAYPVVLLFLLPVIAIEAFYLCLRLRLRWWPTVKEVSIVNAVTLVLGYPLAWGIMFGVQLLLDSAHGGVSRLGIERAANPVLGVLGILGPAWAWLYPTDLKWPIVVAFVILLAPSFLLSGFVESLVIRHYGMLVFASESATDPTRLSPGGEDRTLVARHIGRAVWLANVWSYLFLAAAGCLTIYVWLAHQR
jgi:hypothetical protein